MNPKLALSDEGLIRAHDSLEDSPRLPTSSQQILNREKRDLGRSRGTCPLQHGAAASA